MSTGYVKLFGHLLESTVWMGQPPHVKLAWITILAKADSTGRVTTPVPSLAALAGITLQEFEYALEVFLAPDRYSRSQEYEGRRLLRLEDEEFSGFFVINYGKYRSERATEERRDQWRRAQAKRRAELRAEHVDNVDGKLTVNDVSHGQPRSAQAEAEAEAEAEADPTLTGRGSGGLRPPEPPASGEQAPLGSLPRSPERSSRSGKNGGGSNQKRSRGKSDLPKDWAPNDHAKEVAAKLRLDLEGEAESFRAYYGARGKRMVDWDLAFYGWLRKSGEMRAERADRRQGGSRLHPTPQPLNDKPLDVRREKF